MKQTFLFVILLFLQYATVVNAALTEGTNAGFVLTAPTANPGVGYGFVDDWAAANPFVAPANAREITSMGWYSYSISEAANFQLGLYSHNSTLNRPQALLATTGDIAKGTSAGWKTGSISYPLVPGTTYWIAVQVDNTATATNIEFTNGAGPKEDYNGPGITALKSTWTTSGNRAAALLAVYAVYVIPSFSVNITNPFNNTNYYTTTNVTLNVTALGNGVAYNASYSLDGAANVTLGIIANNSYNWTYLGFLSAGSHNITVTAQNGTVLNTSYVSFSISAFDGFSAVWNTSKAGSASNTIILPITGTYFVDWGDGKYDFNTTTHVYASQGTYTVNISNINITSFGFGGSGDVLKIINILQWGDLYVGNSGKYFMNCYNLNSSATDNLNLTGTTDLSYMFFAALSFNGNISGWNTSNVTDMYEMFYSAYSFNQNIGGWDTGNVINMSYMFGSATVFNQDLSHWNVSKVINAKNMFYSINLSTLNYDALLNGWSSQIVQPNIEFGAGGSEYSNCSYLGGLAGRNILTNASNNWTITDGGLNTTLYSCINPPATISFTIWTLGNSGTNFTNSMTTVPGNATEGYYFNSTSSYMDLVVPCAGADRTGCQAGAEMPAYRVRNTGNVAVNYSLNISQSLAGTGFKLCGNSTAPAGSSAVVVATCDFSGEGNLNASSWFQAAGNVATTAPNYEINVTIYLNISGTSIGTVLTRTLTINSTQV